MKKARIETCQLTLIASSIIAKRNWIMHYWNYHKKWINMQSRQQREAVHPRYHNPIGDNV